MKYRSRTELIAVILSSAAVEKGVLLTRITGLLLDHGLLEYEEEYKVYKTTKKGFQYLELYKEMDELIRIK